MATRILILLLLAGALVGPGDLSSCGPFLPAVSFAGKYAPIDEAAYLGGETGILQPTYFRVYLIAAYRQFEGIGLSAEDRKALQTRLGAQNFPWDVDDKDNSPVSAWVRMHEPATAPKLSGMERFKSYGDDAYVLNCGDNAFANAVATLEARRRAGEASEDLKNWVAAQDQVFQNCAGAPPWQREAKPKPGVIPAMLADNAALGLRQDRAYQIAAAKFYAGQFDDAAADFQQIAADRSSAWHAIAPYLVARALIRKTTLIDPGAAPAAQAQLQVVLADKDAAPWHESARGLSQYLRARTEPEKVIADLAHQIATQRTGVAGAMNDYRLLLDRFLDRGKEAPRDADLTDWIVTMEHDADGHGLEKWRATHSLPWLVAALTYAGKPDADLMAEAAQVDEHSPAWLTVQFHMLRLGLQSGFRAQGLRHLDAILRHKLPDSSRNLYLAERMRVAQNWDELLRDAPRAAVGEVGEGQVDTPITGRPAKERDFDEDAAEILNRQAPLATLRQAAESPRLPANLRMEVALAVWVRAAMTNDTAMGKDIAPVLGSLAPYLKPQLDRYASAADEKSRAFEAAWLMMNNPGVQPYIASGVPRETPVQKLDEFRQNWFCPWREAGRQPMNAPLELLYQGTKPQAAFLTDADRAQIQAEWKRFIDAGAATTYMGRNAVQWAEAHPDDPRAPQALHLAVRAAHFACGGDADTDAWTERAFNILHKRYAKTEWALQTKFWFKADVR